MPMVLDRPVFKFPKRILVWPFYVKSENLPLEVHQTRIKGVEVRLWNITTDNDKILKIILNDSSVL